MDEESVTNNTGRNLDVARDRADAQSRRLNRDRWIGWWSGVPLVLGGTTLSIVMIIGFIDSFNYGAAQVLQKDGVTHEVAQIREYVSRERRSSSSTTINKVEATYLDEAGQQRTVNLRSFFQSSGTRREQGWYTTYPRTRPLSTAAAPEIIVSRSNPKIAMYTGDYRDAADGDDLRETAEVGAPPAGLTLLGVLGIHVRHVRIRRRQHKPWGASLALLFAKVTGALLASLGLMSGAAYLLLQSSL